MPEKIYISDADSQVASDLEILRIDRRIVKELTAFLPSRRKGMIQRIREHAASNPTATVPLLLRYMDHYEPRIRDNVREILEDVIGNPPGELALIESLFSAHQTVANNAARLLDARDREGKRFREIYVASEKLYAECRAMGVYAGDVRELSLEAIQLYKSGMSQQAFENIVLAHDLLGDRVDWNRNIRRYVQDVLKLSPQLSSSGVSMDSIQSSIKIIMNSMKTRDYRETRGILEAKRLETAIGGETASLFSFLSKRLGDAQIDPDADVSDQDQWLFDSLKQVRDEVDESVRDDDRVSALESIYAFLAQDFSGRYIEEIAGRIDSGESKAITTSGQAMLGLAKILSKVLPNSSSELFDCYLRDRTEAESIDEAPWPSPIG